ncbi:DJ-1/PfpI family protein [Microbispora corallina]|uniref:Glutamine amidotransferase n=1 Tax=Microbispora corallina TaxID=83302 RepID=A0ABQ4GAD2_9ACTN|nr:DJ-1/PfpI family protein [Microbispora corallina]GIH44012.1 glutamine amidotransferase [Microbispora corallina]
MRIVMPLFDRFTALDVVGPYEVLRFLPDAEIVFAAATPGPVRDGAGRLTLTAEAAFAEIASGDLLLVPGGPGTRGLVHDDALLGWIRRLHGTTTWTTSVCTGSLLLAAAGLLDGLPATTHWNAADLLESFGASYTPERVVFQGKIVTAAGVSSGIDMALSLVELLTDRTTAEAVQLAIEYDPRPPFDAGSPDKAPREARDLLARSLRR